MSTHKKLLTVFASAAAVLLAAPVASAQYDSPDRPQYDDPDPYNNAYYDKYGMQVTLGGGATGFTDETLQALTGTAGNYGLRIAYGTKQLFAGEVSYSGTAQSIEALGLDTDAALVSNGLDAALRVNIIPDAAIQPYIMAGVGWRRFDVLSDTNTSSVNEVDNIAEVPASAGLQIKLDDFVIDTRFTFRTTFAEDLVGGSELHTWNVSANAGYEF